MKGSINNLRSLAWGRAAMLCVPCILSLFALTGITARPMLGIAAATMELRAAESRVDQLQLERARLDEFVKAEGFERSAEALRRLRAYIPADDGPVRVHGLVRLAAERTGIELATLDVGQLEGTGLVGERDRVVERRVRVGGQAGLTAITRLVETLRGLGLPTAVRSISIHRESPQEPRFHFAITLGLLHTAPLEASKEEVDA